jgi:hypothetical protein
MSDTFDQGQLVYRIAYGAAARLAEEHRQGANWRDTSPAVAARILAAVARQVGRDPADPDVAEAVDDVLASRRPRW